MSALDTAIPGNVLERLERLEAAVRALQIRNVEAVSIDEMAADLGEIAAGNIINLFSGAMMVKSIIRDGEILSVQPDYIYIVPLRIIVDGTLEIYGDGEVMIL
jgi:hypothetical protein